MERIGHEVTITTETSLGDHEQSKAGVGCFGDSPGNEEDFGTVFWKS